MNIHKLGLLAGLAAVVLVFSTTSTRGDTVIATLADPEPAAFIPIVLGAGPQFNGLAGQYNWTRTGGTAPSPAVNFSTFCIELTQFMEVGQTYTFNITELADAPIPGGSGAGTGFGMGSAKADLLQKLWGGYYNASFNLNQSLAFQVAVWEIIYSDNLATLDVTSGHFRVTDTVSSYATLANSWLGSLGTLAGPFPVLKALSSAAYQDQMFFFGEGGEVPTPVPLPAPLWAGLVLMGVVGIRRHLFTRTRQS
jgi:hypothetical protein